MRKTHVTIADIARELGISKTTVSRVLSGTGRISAETRQKVMDCVKAMDYRPNLLAKGLATSRSYNLGVVLPGDAAQNDMPFFHNCLTSVAEYASKENYDVLVSVASGQETASLERAIKNNKVDGVVITRLLEQDAKVALLQKYGTPFVVIGTTERPGVIQVDSCNKKACCEFTEKLIEMGCTDFVFICGNLDIVVNRQRLEGFKQAVADKGISENQYQIYENVEQLQEIKYSLSKTDELNHPCILCGDDFLCSQALIVLNEQGKQIPQNVQVASFYDSALLAQHTPAVSAIRVNANNIGFKAAEVIFTQLRGDEVQAKNNVDYEFLFRDSTCSK